jgi:hypothetical protein
MWRKSCQMGAKSKKKQIKKISFLFFPTQNFFVVEFVMPIQKFPIGKMTFQNIDFSRTEYYQA